MDFSDSNKEIVNLKLSSNYNEIKMHFLHFVKCEIQRGNYIRAPEKFYSWNLNLKERERKENEHWYKLYNII